MLASMSETSWGDPVIGLDMSELPTGTVTLLLADVEGSTRLWETQPEAMKSAVERLDQTLAEAVAAHGGVRPVEQGEGDSFVIAFARAADAVAAHWRCSGRRWRRSSCASACTPATCTCATKATTSARRSTAPRGCATSPTAARPCYRVRRNRLSSTSFPPDVTLNDLGSHPLRDLPRPERVVQLCHPDLHNDFPPLRTANVVAAENLPVQLSSFIGRKAEMSGIREALADNRLVTLTGAGGAGKTRLGDTGRRRDGHRVRRRGLVRRPGADHRSRCGARDRGSRAGPARPARPADDGRTAAVHSRSPDADPARQLRTPARRQRRVDRRACWAPARH